MIGDALEPQTITRLLGCAPTLAQRKGEAYRSETSGKKRVARVGMWSLNAVDRKPGDPDAQVTELLGKLSSDLDVWRSIAGSFRVEVFFGLFLREWNEGVNLSSASLVALGTRGIAAEFDIYGPLPNESGQPSVYRPQQTGRLE